MPTQKPDKSIDQIVQECGRYPVEAFCFIQECIGVAAEAVHGPPSAESEAIIKWMAEHEVSPEELRRRFEDGELPSKIAAIIQQLGGAEHMNRHVTGQQLCWAIRDAALKRWGLMARAVLARWNVTRTEDIGAIVFALVNNGLLQKQPTDTQDDFNDVYGFREAFDKAYRFE